MREFFARHKGAVIFCCLLALFYLYLGHLGSYHLMDPDEGRYHEIPREMLLSGDFLTPHLNGMPYFEKPILQYWISAAAMYVFGIGEFAGRFAPAISGITCTLLAGWLGSMMFGRRAGFLAAAVLGTSCLNLIVSSIDIIDMLLTACFSACMVLFYAYERSENKKYLLLFYAAMGLGVLAKGLIAIIFPFGIIFWYAILTRRPRLFLKLFYLPGIIVFLIVCVPWFYLVCQANPDFFYFFFIREHFLRFTTKMHDRFQPWWFFIPFLIIGMMPWTGFFASLFSKKGIIRNAGSQRARYDITYLLLWFGLIYVFYSISDSKLVPYIMPCWMPMALLVAGSIKRCAETGTWLAHGFLINAILCLAFVFALVGYVFASHYLTIDQFIAQGGLLTASLFIGTVAAAIVWRKTKSFYQTAAVLCAMGFFFGLGLHQVQKQIHNNQSAYGVSQRINELNPSDAIIVDYGEYYHGIVFYTGQRTALSDFKGEMEYGLSQPSGAGMYYEGEELRKLWNSDKRVIVVVKYRYLEKCKNYIDTPPAQTIREGQFTIFVNK